LVEVLEKHLSHLRQQGLNRELAVAPLPSRMGMTLTGHPLDRAIWATAARLSSDTYGAGDRTRFHWCAKDEPRRSHRGFLLPVRSGLGQTGERFMVLMRILFIAISAIAFSATSALAGDLGIYDLYLSGVNAKSQSYDQTSFKLEVGTVVFSANRLTVVVSEDEATNRAKWMYKINDIPDGTRLQDTWITQSQVLSYDYHIQQGWGTVFKILYLARDGQYSVATFALANENTAKSFHNSFLRWLSKKLNVPEGQAN
jgi:hypothetical protein